MQILISIILTIVAVSFYGQTKLTIDFKDCRNLQYSHNIKSFKVYKNDTIFKLIHYKSEKDLVLKKLQPGEYKIEYVSLFRNTEFESINIPEKGKYKLNICLNKLDTVYNVFPSFISQISDNDTMHISVYSSGCFHQDSSIILIYKEKNEYRINYELIDRKITPSEVAIIEQFENELRYMNRHGCTTIEDYIVKFKDEFILTSDGGCNWNGIYYLKKDLHLYSTE